MLSILIPVRNESESLEDVVEYFSRNLVDISYEVIIINDFSEDDTLKKAESLFLTNTNFKILDNKRQGLGGAINLGIKEAKGDYIAIMMADRSDDIQDLKNYYNLIISGNYDAILGSRFLKSSKSQGMKQIYINRKESYYENKKRPN